MVHNVPTQYIHKTHMNKISRIYNDQDVVNNSLESQTHHTGCEYATLKDTLNNKIKIASVLKKKMLTMIASKILKGNWT